MLDSAIKEQLKGLFAQLDAHYTFDIFVHPRHESRAELVDLLVVAKLTLISMVIMVMAK